MLPVEDILGKVPVVPVGPTGTIPFSMQGHAQDFVNAIFDNSEGAGDGSRWWYINSWALGWSAVVARGIRRQNDPQDRYSIYS